MSCARYKETTDRMVEEPILIHTPSTGRYDTLEHHPQLHPICRHITPLGSPEGEDGAAGTTRCLFGSRILFRQRYISPAPAGQPLPRTCLVTKWAVQRLGAEMLQHSRCPHSASEPFLHHWVCEVELERPAEDGVKDDESYRLEVRSGPVTTVLIRAATCWGAVHAITTLKQHLRVEVDPQTKNSTCSVDSPLVFEDGPVHRHRGAMVDCVQSFLPLPKLRQLVNLLAYFKMNVLHWQLGTSAGTRLTEDVHDASGYTTQDVEHMLIYAHRRGVEIMIEFDPPYHSNDDYLRQIKELYYRLHYTYPCIHLGGMGGHHAGHKHVISGAQQPDDIDRAADICMEHMQPFFDDHPGNVDGKPPPFTVRDKKTMRDMFRHHWTSKIDQAKRKTFAVWRQAYHHQPGVVAQCNENNMLSDHTGMILSPTGWHVDRPDQEAAASQHRSEAVQRTTLPINPHVIGGEICFWNPWTPSLTTLLAYAAHTLWCGSPLADEGAAELQGLAGYANRRWPPLAPPAGHAMDLRDAEGISRQFQEAQAKLEAKKSEAEE